jgi:Ca2+-binding RTX toxin-like protein
MAVTIDLSSLGDGAYTIQDDGIPGNGTSIVLDPLGNIIGIFAHPADTLTILSRPGQSLNIDITDSLTTANVTVGSLTNAAVTPDSISIGSILTSGIVTLAAAGAISELGSDAGADIIAGTLLMDAGTGIGIGNAIETQASFIEAESFTGGVAIGNTNNLIIGGVNADLRGFFTTTSADVVLTNQGSITLADDTGVESLHSTGNLTLFAGGAASDISSTVDQDALFASGNIALFAERDVSFGTTGSNFDNDVRAGGSITIQAGRDFNIDGFADMAADDQGLATGGGITITAGRNINIEDNNGSDASVGVNSLRVGSVVLTTGVGGTITLAAGSSASVFAGIGGVFLNTDRLVIEADSGISVGGGGTATIATASAGRAINLGVAIDGILSLNISDAELDRIFATNVVVGSDLSGDVTVVSDLTTSFTNFEIRSGNDINVMNGIAATNLNLRADGDILQLVGSTITAGVVNIFVDQDGAADASGGVGTLAGVTSGVSTLNGNVDDDTLTGNSSGNTLNGDAGDDDLDGGAGNDILNGGLDADTLDGGADFDHASYANAASRVTVDLADVSLNTGEAVGDIFTSIEGLIGSAFSDSLFGDASGNSLRGGTGNDKLFGRDGDDALLGEVGKDKLSGGIGLDTLTGGLGADRLTGGSEADIFLFSALADSGTKAKTRDTIVDFKRAELDRIDLQGIDAIASTGGDDAFTFIGKAGFNDVEGELRFQKSGSDTLVLGDVDGDGKSDFSILLDASIKLKVVDFFL